MSDIAKYTAYAIGGSTLVAGSFFLVAALSGTPMNAMRGVGSLFPPEPQATTKEPVELTEAEVLLESDTRSPAQIFDAARSPLTNFVLESPFSTQELSTLENELLNKMGELDKRKRSLDEREAMLDSDAEHLERQFRELDRVKGLLLNESDEQRAIGDEIEANRAALAAREMEVFKGMAPQYEEGEPEIAAAQLMNVYEPAEAAKVLKHLPPDRVREILSAILTLHAAEPEKHKAYSLAYALERAK